MSKVYRTWLFAVAIVLAAALGTSAQTFTTLFSFDGADGAYPVGLTQGRDSNLYGITGCGGNECGTVFGMNTQGQLVTLYRFCSQPNCTDGFQPVGLVLSTDGNFYGTTSYGGNSLGCNTNDGCGTIFRITPRGQFTSLYSFCSLSNCSDGFWPYAGLVEGIDGNYYGTTYHGGINQIGTVFKITPSGVLTTLHSFSGTDGNGIFAGLIQGTDGNFYGTTQE